MPVTLKQGNKHMDSPTGRKRHVQAAACAFTFLDRNTGDSVMNYKTVFANAGLSLGFEFVSFEDHKVKLKCKSCGFTFEKWDDFLRRSYHGKVRCPNCKASTKYIHQGREPKTKTILNAEDLTLLVNQGKSVSEICSALNVGEYRVRKFLKENNLETARYSREALAKMEKAKAKRIENGSASWKEKFDQLNIDGFEYVRFKGNRTHLIRCKKCGEEFTRQQNYIFKGEQKTFICPSCRNGAKCYSDEADEVLSYYAEGHSVKETAQRFGITEYQVADWAKLRHVSNGRTFEQAGRECNRLRHEGVLPMPINANQKRIEYARIRWSERLSEFGFELIEYKNKKLTFKCLACGGLIERETQSGLFKRDVSCPICRQKEREFEREKAQAEKTNREAERNAMREAKKAANPLGLSAYQLEREKILDLPHSCKVCGAEYTIRAYMESIGTKYKRDSGFCSKECRDSYKKQKEREHSRNRGPHSEHHYDRAKRLGLPAEKGVTLKKLYIRDGGVCQICGMACSYSGSPLSDLYPSIDHIIPMGKDRFKEGGHTWSNVQLAHRICNSVKSAKRGEEWHNGTEKTA